MIRTGTYNGHIPNCGLTIKDEGNGNFSIYIRDDDADLVYYWLFDRNSEVKMAEVVNLSAQNSKEMENDV
jgi:L-rhamnose mutarotase